jgi:hypothetical protein
LAKTIKIITSDQTYYSCGTITFKDKDRTAVLNSKGELFWVEKHLINSYREGDVVWLIYKKSGQDRVTQTVIPYEDAKLEDISKDFDEEKLAIAS